MVGRRLDRFMPGRSFRFLVRRLPGISGSRACLDALWLCVGMPRFVLALGLQSWLWCAGLWLGDVGRIWFVFFCGGFAVL